MRCLSPRLQVKLMVDLTIKGENPGSDIIIQLSSLRLTSLIFLNPFRKLPKPLFNMQVAAILLAVLAVSSAQYAYPGFGGGYQGIYPGQQVGGYYPSNYGGFYPGGQQAFGGFANAYPYGGYNAKSVVVPQVAGSAAVAKTIPAQVKYVAAPQATPYAAYPYGAVSSQYPAYPTAGQIGGVAAPGGVAGNGVYFSSPSYQYSY